MNEVMRDQIPTFFSIKNDDHCASYLDAAVQYIHNNYVVLCEFAPSGLQGISYNIIVEDMLDDIDVHHYPLGEDF